MGKAAREKARKILDILEQAHPDARIYLNFGSPLELLLATIMAAQCTDERVNQVAPVLFSRFPTPQDLAEADPQEVQQIIRSTGFFRRKTESIQAVCAEIVERYGGKVPQNVEELAALPGVGRKTANVVLANAFGQQAIAVDTHVQRVSTRLGLAKGKDPDKIEAQLCQLIPQERWARATQLMGTHGRRICAARKPDCEHCPVSHLCDHWAEHAGV